MNLPIQWLKDENGKIIGYKKYTDADALAIKEDALLKMYKELETLKEKLS